MVNNDLVEGILNEEEGVKNLQVGINYYTINEKDIIEDDDDVRNYDYEGAIVDISEKLANYHALLVSGKEESSEDVPLESVEVGSLPPIIGPRNPETSLSSNDWVTIGVVGAVILVLYKYK